MTKVFIKPTSDQAVLKEDGKKLAPEGEVLERSVWWIRRANHGEVTLSDIPKEAVVEQDAATPAKSTKK
ncbi:hypothetical protein DLREEDagrD3_28980 [Denitratisoma sp. agr-D3]